MELIDKALEISKRPHVIDLDHAWKIETVVVNRIGIVCAHVAQLFETSPRVKATPEQVANHELSGGNSFSSSNPADIALLIFEVVAERNRNPQLWNEREPGGIDDEIRNTISKFMKGPSVLSGDLSQGIRESTYSAAKQKLIENLEARMF